MIETPAYMIKKKLKDPSQARNIYAVIYARVSTKHKSQEDSCDNQISLAKQIQEEYPCIVISGIYVDNGISGKNDKRPEYQRMLNDIKNNNIDLVIIKEFSRLNRNVLNSELFVNLCISNNSTVMTSEDHKVWDFHNDSDLMTLHITFMMDAGYTRNQKMKSRISEKQRRERKDLQPKDRVFGLVWIKRTDNAKGHMEINPDEAPIVKEIYERYTLKNDAVRTIQKDLAGRGIDLSEKQISRILIDPKYIGKFTFGKQTSDPTDPDMVRRINLPENKWTTIEIPELRIIDDVLFKLTERKRKMMTHMYANDSGLPPQERFRGRHEFSSIVFCKECGKSYTFAYSDRSKQHPIYRVVRHELCCNRINRIDEKMLEDIVLSSLSEIAKGQKQAISHLKNEFDDAVKLSENNNSEIKHLEKEKSQNERKRDNLKKLFDHGGFSDDSLDDLMTDFNNYVAAIKALSEEISRLRSEKIDDNYIEEQIRSYQKALADLTKFNEINREMILSCVNRIEISVTGDIDIMFKTGVVISARISDLTNGNSGNTTSKDISDNVVKKRHTDDRY